MSTEQGTGKLPPTADTGRSVVGNCDIKSPYCSWCREVKDRSELLRCGSCLSVDYCRKTCQKDTEGNIREFVKLSSNYPPREMKIMQRGVEMVQTLVYLLPI